MAFQIRVAQRASQDVREALAYIRRGSALAANNWFRELVQLQKSLEELPERYACIPETKQLSHEYRSVTHYSHRIIYRVDPENQIVYIVRVYHAARRPLIAEDIDPQIF
ncbi:type II toxin-antitoxin system RelE/ParE family toxin [bacterium]|nr:MAG: type II toxin-antitoxin system RelE/ParE family toxin [bacterium]